MKVNTRNISIKKSIILVFMSAMMITLCGIGYLVFLNWFSSARQTTESIAENMSENICNQIISFIHVPDQINETNHKILTYGILDLNNEKFRDKFFVGVLSSYDDEIYSFSYGTATGEYYGARKNENGIIEIMKNNAATGGNSWYYSVNEDLTAGELAVKAGKFDPRTRAWYQAAEAAGAPTLSPVYKHFVMNDLTISAAWPVYNGENQLQGVLGTHMLLSGIGTFLEHTVSSYHGYAIIAEKDTGALIANSLGEDNFSVLQDGTFERHSVADIQNADLREAYQRYSGKHDAHFLYAGENEKLYINVREIQMEGIDWVVMTAIPEGLLMNNVMNSIQLSVLLAVVALILSVAIYNAVAGKLLKPISNLLQAASAFSSGDLSKRAEVIRNDEIGGISESLNKVADEMQYLINNLETNVKERTEELNKTNVTLEESKNQLRLILDSAAEAIYGIDLSGNCTFCNMSCIRLLGYNSQEELLGKNMHNQIHHSRADGTPLSAEECRIYQAIREGKGTHADDEVFWRPDGTYFGVEYHSYPQIKNGELIGAVVTFMDITDRKQKEAEIQYLSCHDTMTGLYNRRCLEDNRDKIDIPDNLPISVIFADINGLKMMNDIFGHAAGDELIKKSAEILKQSCPEIDMIARTGGDEFIILLPKTNEENVKNTLSKIKVGFSDARIAAIKCSIALGCDTKTSAEQSLEEIMTNAENAMYRDKAMNRYTVNKDMIDTIVETLHSRSPREKQHSINVSELCGEVGRALQLPEPEINKLIRAGFLHDVGKITLDESILLQDSMLEEEIEGIEKMRQHSLVGYRILNLFDDTLDLAEYVYGHHERWDGTGYPSGIKGDQIPRLTRIVSITETYERALHRGDLPLEERKRKAIDLIKEGAGTQFDPQIAELFVQMMEPQSS